MPWYSKVRFPHTPPVEYRNGNSGTAWGSLTAPSRRVVHDGLWERLGPSWLQATGWHASLQHISLAGLLALAMAVLLSCGPSRQLRSRAAPTSHLDPEHEAEDQSGLPEGLTLRLSDSQGLDAPPTVLPVARTTPLSAGATAQLLSHLPSLETAKSDRKEFVFRERSQPPPRAGAVVQTAFPTHADFRGPKPPDTANLDTERKHLEVQRVTPVGEVPLAPHVSLTFSQPMVAVTSRADASAHPLPASLSPKAEGTWRWLGTRTLLFQPTTRLPQATNYTLDVPAGTRAATGQTLAAPARFTFATATVRLMGRAPEHGPQRRDTPLLASFDQAIDPSAVLKTIRVSAAGRTYRLRSLMDAPEAALKRAPTLATQVAALQAEHSERRADQPRYVLFETTEPLPAAAHVTVTVGPGTPSAEGPRKTADKQTWTFQTYGPLKVEGSRCGWGRECPPRTPWTLSFSNPLDEAAFDLSALSVEPVLKGLKAEIHGSTLRLSGPSRGRTRYRVTLPASLTDRFGQTLGQAETVTFAVGSARPSLSGPTGLVVLDPADARPSYSTFSLNYRELVVKVWKVNVSDWHAFNQQRSTPQRSRSSKPTMPGRLVIDRVQQVGSRADEMVETRIDLDAALEGGRGHAIVQVEPRPWPHDYAPPRLTAWVQATHIGLDAFVDGTDMVAWTTDLATGKPLKDVALELAPDGVRGQSDAQGLAKLGLGDDPKPASHRLLARRGNDVALLPATLYSYGQRDNWERKPTSESLRWFVFDDRKLYRPGERVRLKGWIRRVGDGKGGDVLPLAAPGRVRYVLKDALGVELRRGTTAVGRLGGFAVELLLPRTPNLGHASLALETRDGDLEASHSHSFQIQEFRRPEFEVSTQASQGPHALGKPAEVTVKAAYFAGGALANAEVSWRVTSTPGTFAPPGHADFTFGRAEPWFGWRHQTRPAAPQTHDTHTGRTGPDGTHALALDFLTVKPPQPMQVTAQATVTDVNRQAWAAQSQLLVHPSDLYVGLRPRKRFFDEGEPLDIDFIAVDQAGNAVVDSEVAVTAARLSWAFAQGSVSEEEEDAQSCEKPSARAAVTCVFKISQGGRYRITARVADTRGRLNETVMTVWVAGGVRPPARKVTEEQVELIPDKAKYAGGETARVLVSAPFYPAEGLLSLRRSGVVYTRRFRLEGPSTTLEIPIRDAYVPNVHLQIDLVGKTHRLDAAGQPSTALPPRPAFAKGTLNLPVPPLQRTLSVVVEPEAPELAPGEATALLLKVRDAQGRPVEDAEVAVVVVDEATLALTQYRIPSPIETFYLERDSGTRDYRLRTHVTLADPRLVAADGAVDAEHAPQALAEGADMMRSESGALQKSAPGTTAGVPSKRAAHGATPIAVRTNFDPLAVFAPSVRTSAEGTARVEVELPDNLTRYRVTAVAVHQDRAFGSGESSVVARLPLMLRPAPARFLNFGDRAELPFVVQNQTAQALDVELGARAENLVLGESAAGDLAAALAASRPGVGVRLRVGAHDRVEVRLPAAAAYPGTARFHAVATAGGYSDAASGELPVYTPATTEAFATYGELDDGAKRLSTLRQPVIAPTDVVPGFGGLEVTTTSTQLQALTDALLYLVRYPYAWAEQTASRVLAVAALRDVLAAFEAEGLPPPGELEAIITTDLERLARLQNADGGFGFWHRGQRSRPYVSIHAAHALARAKAKGYAVPARSIAQALNYLTHIERHIPEHYAQALGRSLKAYALYTRAKLGDADPEAARSVLKEASLDELPLEAAGWLLAVLSGDASSNADIERIHRLLNNRVTETASAAHFTSDHAGGAHRLLASERRADGVILEALIGSQPSSDLIPKVVRGLLAHRQGGRWANTQDNAFVLLALDRYFAVFEKSAPNFVARAWLGDAFAGGHHFRGRTTERHHVGIPMAHLLERGSVPLTLSKEGPGRLYYRVGMNYAPADLRLRAADHGFAVERRYESVDHPGDVTQAPDGSWQVKAGARVRVRLTLVAPARRHHVALVDPLPAGLEPLNPGLATTGDIPEDPEQPGTRDPWSWQRTWYEHQNMRDERVEAFTSLLWEGVHTYTYVARATTRGRFVVPPAKAEEMYTPETFGRSASTTLTVE